MFHTPPNRLTAKPSTCVPHTIFVFRLEHMKGEDMKKDRHQAAHIVFRCSQTVEDTISKIAAEKKLPKSEVLRQVVDAGLVATGYKQDEDHLEKLIQAAVQTAFKPSVERLAAISAKAAQISGAAFFMNVYMGQLMLPASDKELVKEVVADARKLGIEYLKLKDQDVDAFLKQGTEKVIEDI